MIDELVRTCFSDLRAEDRYYRQFHHTVWTIFLTLYITLLAAQLAAPDSAKQILARSFWVVISIFFVLLPGIFLFVVIRYHLVIIALKRLTMEILESIYPVHDPARALDLARSWYARTYRRSPLRAIFEGLGHWFFLLSVLFLVAANAVVFFSRW